MFIIAEMACSHEGDPRLAKKIVDAAAQAGSDAIQLQIWSLTHMMAPQRPEYEMLKKIELTRDQWSELVEYSRQNHPKMQVFVCVYEHHSIPFIESLNIDGYKLNSSDLSNPLVLEKVAATGKQINLSIGASTLGEIQAAVGRIRTISEAKITLMYGHQSFPTLPENVHMNFMKKLRTLFDFPIGYQDHCDAETESAFWLPAAAVGLGIDILEKHITHDRSLKGIDYESALNPDEFVRFVEMVHVLESSMGSSEPRPFSDDELKYREFQKKSIVAAHDLPAGTELTKDHLIFMRAEGLGLAPDQIGRIIGKKIQRDIPAFQQLSEADLR